MNGLTPGLMLRSLLALLLPLLLIALPAHALDTSAGVGLQDRALFQETVDYTLTWAAARHARSSHAGQDAANRPARSSPCCRTDTGWHRCFRTAGRQEDGQHAQW